jgi:hypothetical protein
MATHTVDVTRVQLVQQGIPVSPKNPMPVSRGSMFASVPAPRPNQHVTPKIRVSGLPAGTPALDVAPVPPASIYSEPPAKVTAESKPEWLR